MRIVIDARMLYWTGVGRYTKALLDELEAMQPGYEFIVLVRRADWALWEPKSAHFTKVECNINPYSLGEQIRLAGILMRLKPDLVHFTAPNAPIFYTGARIVNIHDLTLLDFDTSRGSGVMRWLRSAKRWPFKLVLLRDVRTAKRLITVTQYVAGELVRRYGVKPEIISTTLLAADAQVAEPADLARFGLGRRYVFYIGNAYPYKNIASSIRALPMLGDGLANVELVIAGKPDTYTVALKELAEKLGVTARVHFVGFVSDGEMVSLYRGASAYINPSLSEGFGLQGLEAMAQGCPVVAARATCLPEVYGEAAEYFDPHNPADQAAALGRVIGNAGRAQELRSAGQQRLKQFSWAKMAKETVAAYEAALKVS